MTRSHTAPARATGTPLMSGLPELSRDEVKSLVHLLTPLVGRAIPVAGRSPVPVSGVIKALKSITDDKGSLDALLTYGPDGDAVSVTSDILPDPSATEAFDAVDDADEAASYLAVLDPDEAEVITVRYGFRTGSPKTLRATGETLGLSRPEVEWIEKRALAKMRLAAGASQAHRNPRSNSNQSTSLPKAA